MRRIEFEQYGSNTIIGNFEPGDVMRCGDDLAHHLVAQAKVAHYAESAPRPEESPRRRRERK